MTRKVHRTAQIKQETRDALIDQFAAAADTITNLRLELELARRKDGAAMCFTVAAVGMVLCLVVAAVLNVLGWA